MTVQQGRPAGPQEGARRVIGVVLLIAALLAAVVLTRVGGSRTAGIASAPRGATLPSVGDCVESLATPLTDALIAGGEARVSSFGEESVRFSHCADAHVGEVIAFRSMPAATLTANGVNTGTGGGQGAADWCQSIAEQYAQHTVWRFRTDNDSDWVPSVGQRFIAVTGAAPHDPTGSDWSTCAVLSSGLEPYQGSYMRSLADVAAPPPFGRCRSGWEVDTWVSCLAPHRTQEFGTRQGPAATEAAALAGCRSLIGVMTGMSDVTRDGSLRVEVVGIDPPQTAGVDVDGDGPWSGCRLSITGDRPLVGTLIGIGDEPLPLA